MREREEFYRVLLVDEFEEEEGEEEESEDESPSSDEEEWPEEGASGLPYMGFTRG